LQAETVNLARTLEGSVRNTGIHACGVIITPDDITKFVPVALAKDSDQKTYELFQRGETVGVFQYESPGMQKHLRDLKPTVFEDLIAMNALYRPGPMEYIPSFVRRKHGDEDQTAYLKAHYPAEYMAAVLSNNMNDIKQVTFFMDECKRMKLDVLGPDVNESFYKFSVNQDYAVRFGMGAIKGVGHGAVMTIVEHRKKDGPYKSIFDFAKRIDLRAANKKAFENLALAGGFDGLGDTHRAQYFHDDGKNGARWRN